MLGSPKIRAGCIGGSRSRRGDGESKRASRYANPPSNLGLNGFQLATSPDRRRGYTRAGLVGVSGPMSLKGEPL